MKYFLYFCGRIGSSPDSKIIRKSGFYANTDFIEFLDSNNGFMVEICN